MTLRTIENLEVKGKVVLLRCDLNIPIDENGEIIDITRIERLAPTVRYLSSKGAKIGLLAHFGRPNGKYDENLSLGFICECLAETLKAQEIIFIPDCVGKVAKQVLFDLEEGGIALLENVRFHEGEEANGVKFSRSLAEIADIYVNDAFSVSHRKHSSVYGITKHIPSYAGLAFQLEIEMLEKVLKNAEPPTMGIIGGSKVSTKLNLINNLMKKMKYIAIGGGMANTFLAAKGIDIGSSFYEKNMLEDALQIITKSEKIGCELILPTDVVVADKIAQGVESNNINIDKIAKSNMILDIGVETIDQICNAIALSKTLLWNGPLGVFEVPPFDQATSNCALTVAMLTRAGGLVSIAGGGDTVSALNNAGASGGFSYVSVAGGAFLEWIEGKKLPGISVLNN